MWIQLYGESINMDNVSRFWLEQDRSSDNSIIPTLKIQLTNHSVGEWLEFEIHSKDKEVSSIDLAQEKMAELRTLLGQAKLL